MLHFLNYQQTAPAISLLHKHLSLMLPLAGEILSRSVTMLQEMDGCARVRDKIRGKYCLSPVSLII